MKRQRSFSSKPYYTQQYKKPRYTYQKKSYSYAPQSMAFKPHPSAIEKKVNDLTTATYQVNTSGSITLLANPVLGSDFNNRIGRKVVLKSAYIRGQVKLDWAGAGGLPATAGIAAQLARFMLVCDLQPNGAAPAITDILVESTAESQLNLNNRDRFRILSDKTYVFDPVINVQTATQAQLCYNRTIYPVKKYKKIDQEMIFNATNGGTVADITSGALYMVWIGTVASGVGDVNAVVSTRVRYVDS